MPQNDIRAEAIEVNRGAFHAALEALMMDDPHPRGYLTGTPAARLDRALYAYEWAKVAFPVLPAPDGSWSQRMPTPGAARAAVLAWEVQRG